MHALRTAADALVWALAALGVVSIGMWGASSLGVVAPLVVVSGSMEPDIRTGDLLLDRPVPVEEVAVGDVLSLPHPATGTLVTHRVTEIAQQPDGAWHVRMQGDANDVADGDVYVVTDDTVLSPRWQLAGVGTALARITAPRTAVPLLLGLVALLTLSQLPRTPDRPHARARAAGRRSSVGGAA